MKGDDSVCIDFESTLGLVLNVRFHVVWCGICGGSRAET